MDADTVHAVWVNPVGIMPKIRVRILIEWRVTFSATVGVGYAADNGRVLAVVAVEGSDVWTPLPVGAVFAVPVTDLALSQEGR